MEIAWNGDEVCGNGLGWACKLHVGRPIISVLKSTCPGLSTACGIVTHRV